MKLRASYQVRCFEIRFFAKRQTGVGIAGGKLKETGFSHWANPNTGATNETGFTALPAGNRYYYRPFSYFGYYGYWWSSTEYYTGYAWYRYLHYDNSSMNRSNYYKSCGFSVRCVRD